MKRCSDGKDLLVDLVSIIGNCAKNIGKDAIDNAGLWRGTTIV